METRLCKRGHKMKQVGRGDRKRWVCNKCRAASRRANSSGSRRSWLGFDVSWSAPGFTPDSICGNPQIESPAADTSYYDRPTGEGRQ